MISRRAFLQGLMVSAAGLLVPEPAKIIVNMGANLSRMPDALTAMDIKRMYIKLRTSAIKPMDVKGEKFYVAIVHPRMRHYLEVNRQ
jgi:hypothetical protein